jgi:hypothetical protein
VLRFRDGLNINVRLVALGAAAPYFYAGRRGRYTGLLERLALGARPEARRVGALATNPVPPDGRRQHRPRLTVSLRCRELGSTLS